jgi:hypothetical protein
MTFSICPVGFSVKKDENKKGETSIFALFIEIGTGLVEINHGEDRKK